MILMKMILMINNESNDNECDINGINDEIMCMILMKVIVIMIILYDDEY